MEEQKLKQEQELLETRLKDLKKSIQYQREHVSDLQKVLEQDLKRLKSFPWFCYLLMICHFVIFLYGWSYQKTLTFGFHFIMYHWYIRGWYRQIALRIVVPTSLISLIVAFIY